MNYLSIMKKTATFLAIGATVLGALAADRADDGRGLIEAYASNNNFLSDVSPFRWYAGAITGGSSGGAANHAIDRSNPNTWAPESIYQLERWGVHTITFTGLVPGATYLAELHLTENYFGGSSSGGAGSRIFNVVVNDVTKESNLDVYSAAGGPWRALCRQYEVTADASGTVAIRLANVKDNAHTSGAALFGSVAPSTPGSFEANVPDGTADIVLTWSPSTDVRRYYLQRGESASGPWTDVAELLPEESGTHTLAGMFDAMQPYHYRLVASNGVGTAVSAVASYLPPSGGSSLKTRGSTVADDASAIYRIDAPGQASDPVNALASDAVAAQALFLDYAGDSELALGTGQTLTLGILGVGEAGGNLTLSGGGTLVAARSPFGVTVDNPASCLKVDAAASGAGLLTKNGGGRLELNGGHSGFTKFTVNAGVLSAANASAANAPLLSGTGTVEKTGGGVLTVASANPDFSGDLVVREGTLQFNVASPFASAEGRIVVEDGAALDVAGSALAAEAVRMASRTVVVEGAGPDGRGAIVNTSSKSQYNALAHGSLSGDATFGGGGATLSDSAGRWDFRNGSLAMNGHNIEKVGSNMVCLTGVALDPGGTVRISVKEGYWSSETTTGYSGGSANVLDVYGGAFFDVFYLTAPFTWTLNLRDGAAYKVRDGTSPAHNVLNGPVVLEGGTAEVQPGGNCRTTFNGVVSGPGFLWVRGSAGGRLSLMNAANSYSGGTLVSGGDLYAESKGSLPGYGSADTLSVSNGTLILNYAEGKWSADDLQEMANSGILFSNSSFLALSMTNEMELARAISFDLGSMSLYDGGTLRVTQPITLGGGALEVHERTGLVMDGEFTSTLGMRYSGRAGTTLVLTNGAALLVSPTASATTLAGSYAEPARAVVAKDSTFAASTDCAVNAASAAITIGAGEKQAGILTVDGGTVRHKVVLGMDNAAGGGALIQNGGVVENQGGSANDIRYGNLGYGFVELNGGTHTWWGYGTIGGASASGRGAMYQHGGVFDYVAKMSGGRLGLSRGACGVFYMDGGTIDWTPAGAFLALGEIDNPTLGPDSFSTFTLDGADAYADFGNKTAWLGNRTNHTAVINLNNGGTLRNGVIAAGDGLTADRQALASYLNFDGGVFRAAGNISMFRDEAAKKPDAVTVYPGGAVLDTDQYTLTVNAPLERPSGSGVASVAMPDALAAETRFIGPPLVRISGGGGRGATAICLYDSKTRKVTGVKVTCPGTGYTSAPTVTFEGGLGATNRFTGTATLAANSAAGGLVKRGAGVLVLAATNTFGGAVTVEGGERRRGERGDRLRVLHQGRGRRAVAAWRDGEDEVSGGDRRRVRARGQFRRGTAGKRAEREPELDGHRDGDERHALHRDGEHEERLGRADDHRLHRLHLEQVRRRRDVDVRGGLRRRGPAVDRRRAPHQQRRLAERHEGDRHAFPRAPQVRGALRAGDRRCRADDRGLARMDGDERHAHRVRDRFRGTRQFRRDALHDPRGSRRRIAVHGECGGTGHRVVRTGRRDDRVRRRAGLRGRRNRVAAEPLGRGRHHERDGPRVRHMDVRRGRLHGGQVPDRGERRGGPERRDDVRVRERRQPHREGRGGGDCPGGQGLCRRGEPRNRDAHRPASQGVVAP